MVVPIYHNAQIGKAKSWCAAVRQSFLITIVALLVSLCGISLLYVGFSYCLLASGMSETDIQLHAFTELESKALDGCPD